MTRRHVTTSAVAAATLLAALVLPACDDDSDGDADPIASASVSETPDEAAARRQVLDTYDKWNVVAFKVSSTLEDPSNEIVKYAAEPLLTKTKQDLATLRRQHFALRGRATWTARITSLRLEANPATAALEACLDTRRTTQINTVTGKSIETPGQLKKFKSRVEAKQVNGRWFIVEDGLQPTVPC